MNSSIGLKEKINENIQQKAFEWPGCDFVGVNWKELLHLTPTIASIKLTFTITKIGALSSTRI
jgi:hypothetical protein